MSAVTRVGRAYQEAEDRLRQAQQKLALSDALSAKTRHFLPGTERQDYCADLEREAFELFELAAELFRKADKLFREERA